MMRGTTPTHVFNVTIDTSLLSKVRIVYAQANKVILAKENPDVKIEENIISVRLTQEETLLFDHQKNMQIQLEALTLSGDVLKTDIMNCDVRKCLNDEVLV
jgi:hypothetical protein